MMAEIRAFGDFRGKRAGGARIKGIIPQLDGSKHGGDNCAAASEAMRMIIQQQGKPPAMGSPWPPTGKTIRKKTGDKEGGLTETAVRMVAKKEYGIGADVRVVSWSVILRKLRKGYACKFLHRYAPIADETNLSGCPPHNGRPGFRGNHSSVLVGIRGVGAATEILVADPLYDGRRDGVPKGPQFIPFPVLRKAGSRLHLDRAGTTVRQRHGPNKALVSFTLTRTVPPEHEAATGTAPRVVVRHGAKELRKPRAFSLLFDRTNIRSTPRRRPGNVERLGDKGDVFEAFQWVRNVDGKWIGNRAGDEWVLFDGVRLHHVL